MFKFLIGRGGGGEIFNWGGEREVHFCNLLHESLKGDLLKSISIHNHIYYSVVIFVYTNTIMLENGILPHDGATVVQL